MAKNLKINIKNTQIAEAINLGSLKSKLAKKKEAMQEEPEKTAAKAEPSKETKKAGTPPQPTEEAPRIKARSRSAFAEGTPPPESKSKPVKVEENQLASEPVQSPFEVVETAEEIQAKRTAKKKTSEELRQEIFGEEIAETKKQESLKPKTLAFSDMPPAEPQTPAPPVPQYKSAEPLETKAPEPKHSFLPPPETVKASREAATVTEKLGPTGRHVKDLYQRPKPRPGFEGGGPRGPHQHQPHQRREHTAPQNVPPRPTADEDKNRSKPLKQKTREDGSPFTAADEDSEAKKGLKAAKFKEFRDVKPAPRKQENKSFDVRDRHGLRDNEDESKPWRKRRPAKRYIQEDTTIRPTSLKIRIPIAIKDLAAEMKLKSSQLVQKMFLQGLVVTLNDLLEDETTIQLLGQEFGCTINIDTSEEERLRITDKSIKEEITASDSSQLVTRPPVVAFMGHVDHGKTSLIDYIRKSNRVSGEAGAITQHIGAFRCSTPVGDIAILDTPGHEAFSAMRARGADVTDIIVLVVAGDEGMRQQTLEAIQHAKQAGVTIVVAINKCDKPNFNAETVYRQLADQELLPEVWGGQTITVNCSAVTGEGIPQLLEMLALQAEVLELRANPHMRARGSVLESEMHKGMGSVATILVQNGTLNIGDSLVFDELWARVKTMRDEFGKELTKAGPSTPVEITGISGLPEAGQEFIVVKTEREAREIAEARRQGISQVRQQQTKKISMENLLKQASEVSKKTLNILLRADVQGSLEALKTALEKIHSKKADLNIIFSGVGEITESDVQLAAASKAVIIGFHTAIENHAESFVKQLGVQVRLHDIIYHAIDDVKVLMMGLLDKIAQETDKGKAEVKAVFKSSHLGMIAGCLATEGSIHRNNQIRVMRKGECVWKGPISSLKRVKEDVKEVQKGLECGILLNGYSGVQEGDILEAYEITYISQEL